MTKTSIEVIGGVEHTVVWHGEKSDEPLGEGDYDCCIELLNGSLIWSEDGNHFATALPPLPRNPTAEDAPLLYRYMAEGIMPTGYEKCKGGGMRYTQELGEITHATDPNGERVEIAISGEV